MHTTNLRLRGRNKLPNYQNTLKPEYQRQRLFPLFMLLTSLVSVGAIYSGDSRRCAAPSHTSRVSKEKISRSLIRSRESFLLWTGPEDPKKSFSHPKHSPTPPGPMPEPLRPTLSETPAKVSGTLLRGRCPITQGQGNREATSLP